MVYEGIVNEGGSSEFEEVGVVGRLWIVGRIERERRNLNIGVGGDDGANSFEPCSLLVSD